MRISTREAFLGSRPIGFQNKSGWIHMKSDSLKEGWSAEAIDMGATTEKRWAPEDANIFLHYVYSGRENKFIYKRKLPRAMSELWPSPGWDFWYHPDLKIYVILESMFPESLDLIPEVLEDAELRDK